jgi:hypothetical protein
MAGKVDAFLKICLATAVLVASAGVAYYYVIYLPQRDAQLDRERKLEFARAEYARQAEQARLAAQQARLEEEKRAAELAQAAAREASQQRYQTCIRVAENFYSASWAAQCKRIADKAAKDLKDCNSQGLNKDSCQNVYGGRDASPNCSLPRVVGTDLSDELEKSRKRCLDESRAGLQ